MDKNRHYISGKILVATALFLALFMGRLYAAPKTQQILKDIEKQDKKEQAAVSVKPVVRPRVEFRAAGRDPFHVPLEPVTPSSGQQVVVQYQTPPDFKVQGIIWGSSLPQAIINSKVVKVGDEIEGAIIENITKGGVSFSFGGMNYELSAPAAEDVAAKGMAATGSGDVNLRSQIIERTNMPLPSNN